jgi:hypothetical protein
VDPGVYAFRTTFDLSGFDPSTVLVTGRFSQDNSLRDVLVNNESTGISSTTSPTFEAWHDLEIGEGFVAGLNSLEFVVDNGGTGPNPAGLRVELNGTAVRSGPPPIEIHNTGVAGDGSVLPDGAVDQHWLLVRSADETWRGPESYLVDSHEFPIPPWFENDTTSKWICPRPGDTTVETGLYTYRTVFDLTGYDPESVEVIGRYSSDDGVEDVLVNGTSTGQEGAGFDRWHSFSLERGFRDGENYLEVVVVNAGSDPNPSGLRVEIISVSATPVNDPSPEPFIRGDTNTDGAVDVSDAVATLGVLFLGQGEFACEDAADSNDDGSVDISDVVATLGVLFLGQGEIPLPGMHGCGPDPTPDDLTCDTPPASCP